MVIVVVLMVVSKAQLNHFSVKKIDLQNRV